MNLENPCQIFISSLNVDFTIGNNHLLDDVPFKFTAPDFLYFLSLKDVYWAQKDEDKRMTISLAMTELYLSVLLHTYSIEYQFNENLHHLENTVLYGDLLSGAFAEKLLAINEADLLKEWLNMLQTIHQELVSLSLAHKSVVEKKSFVIQYIVEQLSPSDKKEAFICASKTLLLDNDISKFIEDIPTEISENIEATLKIPLSASNDLLSFIGD